tara:strand:- start:29 stop:430 length:402 start_codon:yes stop_codon:yes gene_type:complete
LTDWIRQLNPSQCPEDLTPLQLAWLGDAVWEMHQRLKLCKSRSRLKDMHLSVVSMVKAEAQANALIQLEHELTDMEKDMVKRGRNRVGRGSRKLDASIYAKATGFEALIGWLFLKDPKRLSQILELLDTTLNE